MSVTAEFLSLSTCPMAQPAPASPNSFGSQHGCGAPATDNNELSAVRQNVALTDDRMAATGSGHQ